MWRRLGSLPLCLSACLSLVATAQDTADPYDPDRALAFSQAAIGRQIPGYEFLDRNGQTFALDQLRGKPVVVSLIYTSCYHICPMLTEHVAKVAEIAWDALGENSFAVVTVGFDTAVDRPDRMRLYAAERNIHIPNWYFLSGDEATVSALARNIGFIYFRSPNGFDHLSQTTVLGRDGRVYRQVYGQSFQTPALVEPLKELVFDTPADAGFMASWLDDVRLFCTVFDPTSGRYRFDYSLFVAIFVGVMCLGAVAVFIVRSWKDAV